MDDILDFIVLIYFVYRKDLKLECVSVVVDRSVNVVQERHFEVHEVSQEGACREVGGYLLKVFCGLITVLIILPLIDKVI